MGMVLFLALKEHWQKAKFRQYGGIKSYYSAKFHKVEVADSQIGFKDEILSVKNNGYIKFFSKGSRHLVAELTENIKKDHKCTDLV